MVDLRAELYEIYALKLELRKVITSQIHRRADAFGEILKNLKIRYPVVLKWYSLLAVWD